ncbi:MAG: biotin/lipoyl-binding protein, partial [Lachnospiraceae bacterium]|nr:biotin/lipoyl-binding protein [Lachnospiraceae bacterium]
MNPTTYENDEETLSEGYSLEEVYPETGEYQEEDFSEDDQDSEYYDDSAEDDDQDAEYYDDTGEEEEDDSTAVVIPKKKNFFMRHIVWFIILIVLIIAAIVAFTVVIPRIKAAKALKNVKAPTYEVLEKRNIANSVAVTGTIKAKESRTVSTLVTNTKVVSVSVEVGDYVKAGQEICVFDKENLQTKIDNLEKQMNVATAKSNETVTNAQVDVNKANTNLANDFVDNTTSVARLQQSYDDAVRDYHNACDGFEDAKKTRDEAKNTLNNVEGNYNNAKSRYDPLPDLVKSGAAEADETQNAIMKDYTYWSQQYSSAKSAYDSAASKVTQYETNIQSAEQKVRKAGQELDDAKLKTDRTLISDASNVATSELSQSTKNIEATTTNDSNREQMDSYKTQLDGYVITAPISGIVTSLSVSVGDEFSNNSKTEVCVIQDDSEWIVEGNVEQYDVSNI